MDAASFPINNADTNSAVNVFPSGSRSLHLILNEDRNGCERHHKAAGKSKRIMKRLNIDQPARRTRQKNQTGSEG